MANFYLFGSGKNKNKGKRKQQRKERTTKKQSGIKQNARKRIYTYT